PRNNRADGVATTPANRSETSSPNAKASQNAATHTASDITSTTKPRQRPISAEIVSTASSAISAQVSTAGGPRSTLREKASGMTDGQAVETEALAELATQGVGPTAVQLRPD